MNPHFPSSFLPRLLIIICATGFFLAGHLVAADRQLFGPGAKPDLTKIEMRDAKVSAAAGGGFLFHLDLGHDQKWPGITLPAPKGVWDLSTYREIALTVKNVGTNEVKVVCRVDNEGADGTKDCVNGSLTLAPGKTGTLLVKLNRAGDDLGGKLFAMRGLPVGNGKGKGGIDPASITALVIFTGATDVDHEIEVGDIRATGVYVPPTARVTDASPYFPFVDTFGQYKHKKWPGKITSLADLTTRRDTEAKELAKNPGPAGWDKYGGWDKGPKLEGTGFFRTEKYNGKWWLVDPVGHLFFSQGIDSVRSGSATPIEERATWFDDFPGENPDFKQFLSTGHAIHEYYEGRSMVCFSFSEANIFRKYGPEWRTAYPGIVQKRLRSWGLNTIGNWSDETTRLMNLTPYVDTIGSSGAKLIEGSSGYWSKFPDVFDPAFEKSLLATMAQKAGRSAGDPWCIGYFSDNEMSWGDETSLAVGALKSPPEQAAKKEFVGDLKAKYEDIAKLNAQWGTGYESWDALLSGHDEPDKQKAHDDLAAFYKKIAETYFRTVREVIKAGAPNQLYLGCRFAGVNDIAAVAAAKYCDVVSYNLYRRSIADFQFPGGDKPLLVGEFHFGALDRGMFHPGLVPVSSQKERAQAYEEYMMGAIRHPLFVGAHWFEWMDEPLTGRALDGENYQIGFVDGVDTPYPEMIAASRAVAAKIYRSGTVK